MPFEIVFAGEDKTGSRAQQRLRALRELGHDVTYLRSNPEGESYESTPSMVRRIRHRLRRPQDEAGLGSALATLARTGRPPHVLWIDAVQTVRDGTLRAVRAAWPETRFVWYSEDDMMQPHNCSVWVQRSVPLFDLWVTTKSFNANPEEMPARGARRLLFVDNSYDKHSHRPPAANDERCRDFEADVSFVGTYEAARAQSLLRVARAGIEVRIWGNGWRRAPAAHANLRIENRPVYGEDLARVYGSSKINLAFLRKLNRDLQTCRTVEIPACGGFMLHERTAEATRILAEGTDAAFFGDDDELVSQCRFWLERPAERDAVGRSGRARVLAGGHSHHDRVTQILDAAMERH